ncbi:MAG: TatD family hydrolase [Candidatus Doudnabacteria bacterium]|nr:TatD family hydrolase [Candidatus Doudnabacteria bacterium]
MLIDTHSHVNFQAFKNDYDDVIRRSLGSGVWLINVGTQFETSRRAVELAEQYSDGVYAAVALHPIHLFEHHVDEEETSFNARGEEFNLQSYKDLVLRSTKVVAIGEFGLDYYRMPEGEDQEGVKKVQEEAVKQHLILAKAVDRPLMLHVRSSQGSQDAYEDLLRILDRQAGNLSPHPSPGLGRATDRPGEVESWYRGVIHSFTGSLETAQEFVKRGFYIGLNGIITFDKTGRSEEVVKNTPLDMIVLETDAPYLTPAPYRGQRNEPSYVKYVADKIAAIKGIEVAEVEFATTRNARQLFRV